MLYVFWTHNGGQAYTQSHNGIEIWPYPIAPIAWGYGTRIGTVCTRYFDRRRLLFVVNRRSSGRRHLARGAERAGPGSGIYRLVAL